MSWNLTTWNPGDKQKAAWFNRIQNVLAEWGYFGGVVESQTDLPPTQDEGTFFVVKGENSVYIYFGDTWVPIDLPTWSKVVNTPEGLGSIASLSSLRLDETTIAYFTDSLVDKVNGITPLSYPGTVESYGLRHSSDGNLVVTERQGDVPFPGVKSFAVEEGTTNLLDPNLDNWARNDSPTVVQIDNFLGLRCWNVADTSTSGYQYLQITKTLDQGTYTLSSYLRAHNSGVPQGLELRGPFEKNLYIDPEGNLVDTQGFDLAGSTKLGNGWVRVWGTFTLSDSTTFYVRVVPAGGVASATGNIDACGIQLEQKPFATSFVDGSRTTGKFYIPLESLGFDPVNDDWVIAYWSKPFQHDTYKSSTIGQYTSDSSQGYIWWGVKSTTEELALWALLSDDTVIYPSKTINIDYNLWHFEVVLKSDNELKYYYDGKEAISVTLSQSLKPFTFGLMLGGRQWSGGLFAHNILLANIYFGKAKDKRDNLIWTDDFINYIYNLQRPLFV